MNTTVIIITPVLRCYRLVIFLKHFWWAEVSCSTIAICLCKAITKCSTTKVRNHFPVKSSLFIHSFIYKYIPYRLRDYRKTFRLYNHRNLKINVCVYIFRPSVSLLYRLYLCRIHIFSHHTGGFVCFPSLTNNSWES